MESRVILIMVNRTKKEFRDYNDYKDRPFGLKWGTAYAMDDLMKGVIANEEYALKDNYALPQLSREDIDIALSESFLQHKEVTVQLNLRDEFGRLEDCLSGFFLGEAYEDYFVLNDQAIKWEDARNVSIIEPEKWFNVNIFDSPKREERPLTEKRQLQDLQLIKDEFYQEFPEDLYNDTNDDN